MLKIKDLVAKVNDKLIINNLDLELPNGKIHAIMGQNGTGKSTICKIIMGDGEYKVEKGSIKYQDQDILTMLPNKRAQLGIFLLNQSPIAIEGVTNAELLRASLKEKYGKPVNIFEFNKEMEEVCAKLELPKSFIHREVNLGSSGGERKKTELLHMWMLKPSLIILDEMDSGLDVDALKICAKSLNAYYELYHPSILIITHHTQVLDLLKPDQVHILKDGHIIESGDYKLAKRIEKYGFSDANQLSEKDNYE
jgi:Fe-S cluster assembly ATP-binding protein